MSAGAERPWWYNPAWDDPAPDTPLPPEALRCHAQRDGGCVWPHCPQNRDGEPGATGRSCPLVDMSRFTW